MSGYSRDVSLQQDFQLVQWQHLLPHDRRQPCQGLQAALRDRAGLQDGQLADLLHLLHGGEHQQTEDGAGQSHDEGGGGC